MAGPPMGAMQMPRPVRRGTSKAVPVVVSAGLAVGVFCGLLFGVGTGQEIAAAPSKGNNVKPEAEEPAPVPGAAPKGLGATATVAPKPAPPPAPAPVAAPTVVEPKTVKVIVDIQPEAAAKNAKITIDGTQVSGNSTDIPADKKSVKVEVKASGYRSADTKVNLLPGEEMTVKIEMAKKPSGGGGGGDRIRPPKRPDKPPSGGGGGGLIDI